MMERVDPELVPSLEMYRAAGLDIPLTSNEDFLRYRESYTNFTDQVLASLAALKDALQK